MHPDSSKGPPSSFVENFISKVINKMPTAIDILSSFQFEEAIFDIPVAYLSQAEQRQSDKASLKERTREIITGKYASVKDSIIDRFLEATVTALKKEIKDTCRELLDGIGQESLNKNHRKKMQKMIKRSMLLIFYKDEMMIKAMQKLTKAISATHLNRNRKVILKLLGDVIAISEQELCSKG
jgi:hypothetical protein